MQSKNKILYKNILIKISGESLSGKNTILDQEKILEISETIKELSKKDIKISIIVGGGNIWRGINSKTIDKITSDYMGMTATFINALALKETIKKCGVNCHVMSKTDFGLVEKYSRDKALTYLKNNEIIIFAGGTGNPCFTTDTATALYAIEMGSESIFMVKNNIDGVYDDDPNKNKKAKLIKDISFDEIINKKLKVMDLTSLTLLKSENRKISINVFSLKKENFFSLIQNKKVGTFIHK